MSTAADGSPKCDMEADCTGEVTHLDESGFVYCEPHGIQRRSWKRCRKLRPHELSRIRSGQQIKKY